MANKTRFEDDLGDHDGDNPANWTAGLPRAGYNVQIGEVEACCFSQGYECIQLIIEYDATTVTFDGGDWTFTNDLRLEHGSVFVTDEMTVDGSLYVSDLVDADLTKLSIRYTQADTLEVDVEGLEIGDVVWTSAGPGYYARMFEVNCRVFDVDGEVRFSQYAPLTIRNELILRAGALIDAAGNNPVVTIEGHVTATESGSTWLAGTNGCHFTGSGDQTVDLGAIEGVLDPVIINKPSGRLVLQSSLPCDGLDHQAGELVLEGNAIATSGSCRIAPGARVAAPLDGSVWTIGKQSRLAGSERRPAGPPCYGPLVPPGSRRYDRSLRGRRLLRRPWRHHHRCPRWNESQRR